ncbi:MAG: ABC transporter permease [Gemmatimonadales bacterium]
MTTLALAARALRRSPSFAAAAALTLAIGIGATTAIFTVLDTVLLKPLPYRDPQQLAGVWIALPGMGFKAAPQSAGSFFTFRRFSRLIEGIAMVDRASVNFEGTAGAAAPERLRAALISASAFNLLGTAFERGRGFTLEEDSPHGRRAVILSDGLWRRSFGADANIVGKTVRIDGTPRTVVGVAPESFRFPDAITQLWLPTELDSVAVFGGAFGHQTFVRLKPGVSIQALQTELNSILPRAADLFPEIGPGLAMKSFLTGARASVVVHPMRDDVIGGFGSIVDIAAAAGALLLLIAFANVASLLLTRAEGRQRELAIRVALGAGPMRVVAQFLAESLLLAVIGGLLGLLLAFIGVRLFVHSGPPGIPRLAEMGVDGRVVAFTTVVTACMALLCSAVPAIRFDTRRLASRLRDGTRGGTSGRDRQRARRTFVATQVAFATVLVCGGGLLFRSLQQLRQVKPGFDDEHSLVLFLSLPQVAYRTDQDVVRFSTQLVDRVSAVPGVRTAGISSKVPLNNIGINFAPVYTDADADSKTLPPSAEVVTTDAAYFKAMGIPLVAGRTFDRLDRQRLGEIIIDRSFAIQRWKDSTGAAAIGRQLYFTPDQRFTVIGVVGAVHDTSLAAPPNQLLYVPQVADPDTNKSFVTRTIGLVVRASGDPRALIAPVQRAVADVDRSLPPFGIAPMSDLVEASTARLSFVMTIIGVTACVAVALAAIGLYGVLAYLVSLRSREISVRLAMGALPARIARLITRQGAGLAAVGVGLGVLIFIATSRFLRASIVGVGRPEAATIVAVGALLMLVAMLASWIPARRAARVDPARALSGD